MCVCRRQAQVESLKERERKGDVGFVAGVLIAVTVGWVRKE